MVYHRVMELEAFYFLYGGITTGRLARRNGDMCIGRLGMEMVRLFLRCSRFRMRGLGLCLGL